jgi:hypothetical protein
MTGVQIRGAVRENEIAAVLALLCGRGTAAAAEVGAPAPWRATRRAALARSN